MLSSAFKQNVHVAITLSHGSTIFDAILQSNCNKTIQALSQNIQRFLTRLH